jgi:hypothetical protein
MSPTPKVSREPAGDEAAEKPEFVEKVSAVVLHGMARIAEIQKQYIDLAMQQNAEIVDILKKTADNMPGAPRLPMLDLATGAVSRFAETQKSVIDYFVEQSRVWTDGLKDHAGAGKSAADSVTNVAKQAVERTFAVQKKALENTAAQTKAVMDAAKHQFGFSGKQADAMTDTFQRGFDTIVEAQKELLDLVIH